MINSKKLFDSFCTVLEDISENSVDSERRAKADMASTHMRSIEATYTLSQAVQRKTQILVNASMIFRNLYRITKVRIWIDFKWHQSFLWFQKHWICTAWWDSSLTNLEYLQTQLFQSAMQASKMSKSLVNVFFAQCSEQSKCKKSFALTWAEMSHCHKPQLRQGIDYKISV